MGSFPMSKYVVSTVSTSN